MIDDAPNKFTVSVTSWTRPEEQPAIHPPSLTVVVCRVRLVTLSCSSWRFPVHSNSMYGTIWSLQYQQVCCLVQHGQKTTKHSGVCQGCYTGCNKLKRPGSGTTEGSQRHLTGRAQPLPGMRSFLFVHIAGPVRLVQTQSHSFGVWNTGNFLCAAADLICSQQLIYFKVNTDLDNLLL